MKCFHLLVGLLIISSSLFSQSLTGIWRGNFYAGIGPFQEYYRYEVQIDQLKDNSLQGVTYSYHTTTFYGKATFKGIWFPKAQSAIVKELKLIELKVSGNSDACAMTCNLDYSKEDNKEILKGTFTSINTNTKQDCGSGTVYLEKVLMSDFKKEDFLIKKKPDTTTSAKKAVPSTHNTSKPKIASPVVNDLSKANAKKLQSALGVTPDGSVGSKTLDALKKKLPGFNEKVDVTNTNQINDLVSRIKKANATIVKKPAPANSPAQNKTQPPVVIKQDTIVKTPPQDQLIIPQKKIAPVPNVLKTRSNPLIKTITTNSNDIHIELYDNGDIDGDTITVYDNNEVIAWKKGLTDKPVTLNIKADANTPTHEFVMVADNLGSIPPNTALMIITTGGRRYQLFISSDTQKNAKVVVQYQP
ncbi:MAG: hypothetical protein JO072_15330 [Parafilimonas sp.]|nr:hypothetical protein [Parafilimonas sp.]